MACCEWLKMTRIYTTLPFSMVALIKSCARRVVDGQRRKVKQEKCMCKGMKRTCEQHLPGANFRQKTPPIWTCGTKGYSAQKTLLRSYVRHQRRCRSGLWNFFSIIRIDVADDRLISATNVLEFPLVLIAALRPPGQPYRVTESED